MAEAVPALSLRRVSARYAGAAEPAVEEVSFTVEAGEIVALVGPNGSGKTTLLRAILDLVPWQGEVAIFGRSFREAWRDVGYVPQHFSFDPSLPIAVEEVLRLPLAVRGLGASRAAVRLAADRVGAGALLARPLAELSGGERQRVLLARALITTPRLLILDEPEAGVDLGGEQTLYDLLAELARGDRLSALVASHELDIVYRRTSKVVCLNRRLICQGPPAEVLSAETLERMYGRLVTVYGHGHDHGRERGQDG